MNALAILVIVLLVMGTLTIYKITTLQVVGTYQGIQVSIDGFYVGTILHPDTYQINRLITKYNLAQNPDFYGTQFLGNVLEGCFDAGSGSSETPNLHVCLEQPYFCDKEYKRVSTEEARPIDSWRWEVQDSNGVWHTFVLQVWNCAFRFSATIDWTPELGWFNTYNWSSWKDPLILWFYAKPFSPSYFTGPDNTYFAICQIQVVVDNYAPEEAKKNDLTKAFTGDLVTRPGSEIFMFPEMFSGAAPSGPSQGWSEPLAWIDTDADGQPDAYLSPDVFKPYWYFPIVFTSINSARHKEWGFFGSEAGFKETHDIVVGVQLLVYGDWVGKRIDEVPLQPFEAGWYYIPWWEKLLKFLTTPTGLVFVVLTLLLLFALTGYFPALGTCCLLAAAAKKRREVEVEMFEDFRKFRDRYVPGLMKKLYYNVLSPIACVFIDRSDSVAELTLRSAKIVWRVI